ncbi:hypothetical protein LLG96_09555 [bacterium]|nr:hypothetical protein [bacterium]
MTALIVALIVITGFIFLVIELLLIPGFSVPGLAGLAMIGYGIFKAKTAYGTSGALITLAASLIGAFILIRVALKSRTLKAVSLDYSEKGTSAVDDYSGLVGIEGITISPLRPAGTADIGGKRCDVVTEGGFIEKNSPVRVLKVDGKRIIVTLIERG